MRRVNVIGGSGSGKSTVARALATRLGLPLVEIDAIHWQLPDWTVPPDDLFRGWIEEATRGPAWIVDGSYGKVRDIVWSRADTVVWLDFSFAVMFTRIVRRTIARIRSGEPLWGVQRESIRGTFFSRDSLLLFAIRTHRRRARLYREWLARPEYAHLELVHLRGQAAVDRWLETIGSAERPATAGP